IAVAIERAHEAGELHAERQWQRLLEPRTSGEHRVGVLPRALRERGGEAIDVGVDERERVAQLQHETRVDDVLARRAPMDVAFGAPVRRTRVLAKLRHWRDWGG